jgi:hypothetical protein
VSLIRLACGLAGLEICVALQPFHSRMKLNNFLSDKHESCFRCRRGRYEVKEAENLAGVQHDDRHLDIGVPYPFRCRYLALELPLLCCRPDWRL